MSVRDESSALTHALAEFAAGLSDSPPPSDVRRRTLEVVGDGIGVLLAAADPRFSTFRRIMAFVEDQQGPAEATLIGRAKRTGCVDAALANGTLGYACDFEPHHPEGILHPIAVMVPVALAICERTGATGQSFLDAVTLGCEIEYRLSMALGPAEQYHLGFHPSAVCGCFGAAAAAGFLLGLDGEAMVRAFGLAGCQASGLMAWESDPTENARPFQMGMAARNGVTAALLAHGGFGGPTAIFDHGHTVFHAFSRNPDPDRLTLDLGTTFDGIMELAIKPYSSVSFLHPALDIALGLAAEHHLKPDDIAELTMHFPRSGVHCVDGNPLRSHCAQYVLPVALARGKIEPADLFFDRRLEDRAIADLSARIKVVADDGELERLFPDFYATVITIVTRDGRNFTRRQDIARGYPESWLTEVERWAKFEAVLSGVASPERVADLKSVILGLPGAGSVGPLAALLGQPPDI